MNSGKHILYMFFGLLLLCWSMNAQQTSSLASSATVPRLVNFSSKATGLQGKAISGIAGATFAIYKEESGGSALWLETQNIQANAKGDYTVQLGATKPDGLPLDLFSSGEARWLGVTVNGGQEQPRVLLLSVPYALKAADAETIGGLPPSAFVLAAPPVSNTATAWANVNASAASSSAPPPASSNVTTTGGTVNALPLWTTATNIQSSALTQTGSGATAKIGVNTATPTTTLDVNGAETVRGNLILPATGTATATTGKTSQPTTFTASVFNSGTGTAVPQNFRWQAEPTGNNTSAASGTLNLLFGAGSNPLAETGLKLSNKGLFTFAAGQTFPGTVSSVGLSAPVSDFTVSGSPITKSGTLGLAWKIPPTNLDTANAIVRRDASGSFSATTITATGQLIAQAMVGNGAAIEASSANSNATVIYGGASSSTGAVWGVEGEQFSSDPGASGVVGRGHLGGVGVTGLNDAAGSIGVRGSAPAGFGFVTDSNVQQARTMGGWVKAMVSVNAQNAPYNIVNCFNSTLAGAAATTPPCGINFTENGPGDWLLDFGFEVDDRFLATNISSTNPACIQAQPTGFPTVIDVLTYDCSDFLNARGGFFYLMVF